MNILYVKAGYTSRKKESYLRGFFFFFASNTNDWCYFYLFRPFLMKNLGAEGITVIVVYGRIFFRNPQNAKAFLGKAL